MASSLLCADLSYQTYRAAAAHPGLTCRRVFTGGLYGFWTSWAKAIRETGATRVAFCQDMKPYRRSESYPEYKQLRKAKADESLLMAYKQSMKLVLESLEAAGLEPWGEPGFEVDDLIAHAVLKYGQRYERIIAFANDSDLYQLLDASNFSIFRKSKADLVTRESLRDAFGKPLTPSDFMLMTALAGTHNDVAGIPGVGAGTALKAIRDPATMRKYRDSHGHIIERNLALIKLPHAEFPRGSRIPYQDGLRPRELYKYLGRYDIEVTGPIMSAVNGLQGG